MTDVELTRLRRKLRNQMALSIAGCMSRIEGLYRGFDDKRAEDMQKERTKLIGPLQAVWAAERALGEETGLSNEDGTIDAPEEE